MLALKLLRWRDSGSRRMLPGETGPGEATRGAVPTAEAAALSDSALGTDGRVLALALALFVLLLLAVLVLPLTEDEVDEDCGTTGNDMLFWRG